MRGLGGLVCLASNSCCKLQESSLDKIETGCLILISIEEEIHDLEKQCLWTKSKRLKNALLKSKTLAISSRVKRKQESHFHQRLAKLKKTSSISQKK